MPHAEVADAESSCIGHHDRVIVMTLMIISTLEWTSRSALFVLGRSMRDSIMTCSAAALPAGDCWTGDRREGARRTGYRGHRS